MAFSSMQPVTVHFDNIKNLAGASKVLGKVWASWEPSARNIWLKILWHHNPRRASQFGRLFDAMVVSLKRYIKRVPFISNLTYENFHISVCTWEKILNSTW